MRSAQTTGASPDAYAAAAGNAQHLGMRQCLRLCHIIPATDERRCKVEPNALDLLHACDLCSTWPAALSMPHVGATLNIRKVSEMRRSASTKMDKSRAGGRKAHTPPHNAPSSNSDAVGRSPACGRRHAFSSCPADVCAKSSASQAPSLIFCSAPANSR